MDLTPRLLTEVEFREQWRGYSPSEVDDHLERIAAAVGELQERLREATERAAQAERRLLERNDDDEIRGTLVLAQRTAVTAVEEARAEAAEIIEDAEHRAREQLDEAERRLAALEADIAERTRVELGGLAERRAALQADVDALVAFQEEHRSRLRAELGRQLADLESPAPPDAPLAVPEPPELHDVDLATPAPALDIEVEPLPPMEPLADEARRPTEEEVARAREDLLDALRRAGVDDVVAPAGGAVGEAASEADPEPSAPRLYDAATDESGEMPLLAESVGAGEPTGEFDVLQWGDQPEGDDAPAGPAARPMTTPDDDDPFLTELRRAVNDTEPLGPRDDADIVLTHEDRDEAVPAARFRLRRGK